MNRIVELFENQEYYHAFQPICSLSEKGSMGYEALLRSKAGTNPESLFRDAEEQKKTAELDTCSLYYAISTFFQCQTRQKDTLLFVNLFPSTVVEACFPRFIENITRSFMPFLNRIVLEINEAIMQSELRKDPIFIQRLSDLRARGFLIALDDVRDGAATFQKIQDIAPDFIKMDRSFSRELSTSKKNQNFIRLFVEFCQNESRLILEGVEREEDCSCAVLLGVAIGQGFLLGKPGSLIELEDAGD